MSIFSALFGGGSTPPAQPAPGNTNQNTPATSGTDNNGVVPAGGQTPPVTQTTEEVSPLAQFADVWKTPDTPPGESAAVFAGMDPTKVMESARRVDFSKAITEEQVSQIAQGGEGAVKAFTQAMNSVAQTVYGQSALATAKMVEQALGKAQEQYDAKIPGLVKKLNANESLAASNPMLQNPAVQPLVGALTEQLTRKNPNATSAEIQQQVTDYFAALGNSFAPTPKESATTKTVKGGQTDWSNFLE